MIMDSNALEIVQEFLDVYDGEKSYRMVDVELLLLRQSKEELLEFLEKLVSSYSKLLKKSIRYDKTDWRINDIVAKRFRLKMAANTLRNAIATQRRQSETSNPHFRPACGKMQKPLEGASS
jgi:hypothetical protein